MGVAIVPKAPVLFTQDAKDATSWTTDEKLLLAKFNIVGIDLKQMLSKYFGLNIRNYFGTIGNEIVDTDTKHSGSFNMDLFDINKKPYLATLDNLKQNIFPALNTNVKDALTKILTGEGIIQPAPVTIHEVISTTPVTVVGTTTATTATSTSTALDNLINVASSQKTNQQEVIARLNGYKNASQYGLVSAVLSMPNSSDAIDSAVSIVGLPPFSSNGSWNDTMLQFFALVKYLRTYPLPTLKTTCTSAKTALLALNDELTSIDKNRVIAGSDDNFNRAYVVAVNTIKQEYEGFYAKNDCELKISQQSSQYEVDKSNDATKKNAELISQETGTPPSDTSKYVIYGLGGVAILVVILVAVKLIKK